MTTAKHFLLEVGNIQGMKTIKCKKNGSTAPAMLPQKKKVAVLLPLLRKMTNVDNWLDLKANQFGIVGLKFCHRIL